jgi:hypothetical protein
LKWEGLIRQLHRRITLTGISITQQMKASSSLGAFFRPKHRINSSGVSAHHPNSLIIRIFSASFSPYKQKKIKDFSPHFLAPKFDKATSRSHYQALVNCETQLHLP